MDLETIYGMTTGELWNATIQIQQETEEYNQEIETIKKGIKIQIDIRWIINGWYIQHPKSNTAKIEGYKQQKLTELLDEIEAREMIMRQILIEQLDDEPTGPRT